MRNERDDLVEEIKQQDKKLQLIAKPFGGYRNIVAIDDIFFEDAYIPQGVKTFLKVGTYEQQMNVKFNEVTTNMGLRNTEWGKATIYMFGLWTIGTSFVCFEKPDFLNVSKLSLTHFGVANNWSIGSIHFARSPVNKIIVLKASSLLDAFVGPLRHFLDL